jgi:hypothetical protein
VAATRLAPLDQLAWHRQLLHAEPTNLHANWSTLLFAVLSDALEFVQPIEAINREYIAETRGLAEGAGLTFAEAMLCQTRGALPNPSSNDPSFEEAASETYRRAAGNGPPPEECTAFALCSAATGTGVGTLIGQNQDVSLDMDDFGMQFPFCFLHSAFHFQSFEPCVSFLELSRSVGLVLRVRPNDDRPAAVMFTWAGQLGYSGLNEHGVAHFANGLAGGPRGVPAIPHYSLKRA